MIVQGIYVINLRITVKCACFILLPTESSNPLVGTISLRSLNEVFKKQKVGKNADPLLTNPLNSATKLQ